MNNSPAAKIVSVNHDAIKICASAARISTTKGDSLALLESPKTVDENTNLIQKVLASGHKSFLEHAVFTIAFCDVSAVVEQFMIEFRLASFTIKSRRYVDFSDMGYYTPSNLSSEQHVVYTKHMQYLFHEYHDFIKAGVPKEDARFLLPYSFHSNFYCTVNARELVHILNQIRHGRGKQFAELLMISDQLISQLKDLFPPLIDEMGLHHDDARQNHPGLVFSAANQRRHTHEIELLSDCGDLEKNLYYSYLIRHNAPIEGYDDLNQFDIIQSILDEILTSDRPRELEQFTATFLIKGISLSGLTHLVRHRMQSILIPPLTNVSLENYIQPKSIMEHTEVKERYLTAYSKTLEVHRLLQSNGMNRSDLTYLLLSGNLIDVISSMNARELLLYFQLRTCNRAQWEIRDISSRMLELLRAKSPILFSKFGPSCYVKGYCPEGKLSCNQFEAVTRRYRLP